MFAGVLITLREGIEAFLVVGILIGILTKMGQRDKLKYIWAGAVAAIISSIIIAYIIQLFSVQFEGLNAEVFELLVAGLAIAVLSYMVTWMHKQSRYLKQELENKVRLAVSSNQISALAFLAFITVIREGIETALFLSAVANANQGTGLMTGAIIGLLAAVVISFLVTKAAVHLNLHKFFLITGSLIVVIAGGLLSHVMGTTQELGFPLLTGSPWDMSGFIPDDALMGKLLHAFTGYVAAPTILQILGYSMYVGGMLWFLWKGISGKPVMKKQPTRAIS